MKSAIIQDVNNMIEEKPRKQILRGVSKIHEYMSDKFSIYFNNPTQRKRLITMYRKQNF